MFPNIVLVHIQRVYTTTGCEEFKYCYKAGKWQFYFNIYKLVSHIYEIVILIYQILSHIYEILSYIYI